MQKVYQKVADDRYNKMIKAVESNTVYLWCIIVLS